MLLWSQCSKQATSLEEQTGSIERTSATGGTQQYNQECHGCGPSFKLNLPSLHSGTRFDRVETTNLIPLSLIPEVVWQQPPEISMDNFILNNTNDIATAATTQTAHTPELRLEMMFNYECRYQKEFYLKSENAPEKFQENETRSGSTTAPKTATTKPKKEAPTPQPVAMETTVFLLA